MAKPTIPRQVSSHDSWHHAFQPGHIMHEPRMKLSSNFQLSTSDASHDLPLVMNTSEWTCPGYRTSSLLRSLEHSADSRAAANET